ncbi:MAG: hypothetical protein J6Q24_03410 [Clostridia bacterium]|nr:hypothetical protein [Clostridia bacterium]
MTTQEIDEKFNKIMDGVYKLSVALVSIADFECCEYGFEEEIKAAREYIQKYEEDHKGDICKF